MMGKSRRIELPARLDIAAAAGLHQQLGKLRKGSKVIFVAADIERVDAAILQLLVAFVRRAARQNISIEWHSPSQALYEAAGILGLQAELMLSQH